MKNHWEDEYMEVMGQMKFFPEQKDRLVHSILENGQAERKHSRKHMPMKRLAAAAIFLCILAAGTAGANTVGLKDKLSQPVSEIFDGVFLLNKGTSSGEDISVVENTMEDGQISKNEGTSQQQKSSNLERASAIVDDIGTHIGISDTINGVTITADAMIGDEYHYAIVFSIEKENGETFSNHALRELDQWYFRNSTIEVNTETDDVQDRIAHTAIYQHFYDADPEDASVQYLLCCNSNTEQMGKDITVKFSDLRCPVSNIPNHIIFTGEWRLKFQIDYKDSTIQLKAGRQIQKKGMGITITKVDISPIGYYIEWETTDKWEKTDKIILGSNITGKKAEKRHQAFINAPAELGLSNGETVILPTSNGLHLEWDNGKKTTGAYSGSFEQVIPPEEMESVSVYGISFPVQN